MAKYEYIKDLGDLKYQKWDNFNVWMIEDALEKTSNAQEFEYKKSNVCHLCVMKADDEGRILDVIVLRVNGMDIGKPKEDGDMFFPGFEVDAMGYTEMATENGVMRLRVLFPKVGKCIYIMDTSISRRIDKEEENEKSNPKTDN